jgi:hypothetical protein
LCNFQRFGTDAPKDTKFIREEMQDLEKQVDILQEDLRSAERELSNEKQQGERVGPCENFWNESRWPLPIHFYSSLITM